MSRNEHQVIFFDGAFYAFTHDGANEAHDTIYYSFKDVARLAAMAPNKFSTIEAWAYLGRAFAAGIVEKVNP